MIHKSSNNLVVSKLNNIPRLQEPFTDIGLYPFTSHTFTNAGAVGQNGPTLAQIRTAYSAMPWTERFINMTTQGIQLWTVPKTGEYVIQAFGASARGFGRIIRTATTFNKGDIIRILVGQMGTDYGGGGGTFVVTNSNIPILIAGGGGGNTNRHVTTLNLISATINSNGNRGGASGGNGGSNGNGGIGHEFSSGGGGLIGNGGNCTQTTCRGGNSFINGGLGGGLGGGFGGGGGGICNNNGTCFGGGGGGYSGGGGGGTTLTTRQASPTGGGGGSFSSTNIIDTAEHMGHGLVIITLLEE